MSQKKNIIRDPRCDERDRGIYTYLHKRNISADIWYRGTVECVCVFGKRVFGDAAGRGTSFFLLSLSLVTLLHRVHDVCFIHIYIYNVCAWTSSVFTATPGHHFSVFTPGCGHVCFL